jgi:hypothetical protein
MTINDADKIIKKYARLFEKPDYNSRQFRRDSALPYSKTQIRQALMLDLAHHIYEGTLDDDYKNIITGSVKPLAYYYNDAKADRLDHAYKLAKLVNISDRNHDEELKIREAFEEANKCGGVALAMMCELEDFVNRVEKIGSKDPIFWQRVYTLCGLPYTEPKKKSLWGLF